MICVIGLDEAFLRLHNAAVRISKVVLVAVLGRGGRGRGRLTPWFLARLVFLVLPLGHFSVVFDLFAGGALLGPGL